MKRRLLILIACIFFAFTLGGCENEGSAEKAGKEVDKAINKAEKEVNAAIDTAKKKVEEAKE